MGPLRRIIKMCVWEYDDALVLPLPPPDNDKSAVALARTRLLALRKDTDNPFPKHVVPHDSVAFLRAQTTHVPATYLCRHGGGGDHPRRPERAVKTRTRPRSHGRMRVAHATLPHPTADDAYPTGAHY